MTLKITIKESEMCRPSPLKGKYPHCHISRHSVNNGLEDKFYKYLRPYGIAVLTVNLAVLFITLVAGGYLYLYTLYNAISYTRSPKQMNYDYLHITNNHKQLFCPAETKEEPVSPFKDYRIVCYYVINNNNSTHSRKLPPSYVDPYLCTHIIVGFASITNAALDPGSKDDMEVYKTITGFKKMNPSLKVLLSIEDMSNVGEFSKVVREESLRKKFSSSLISFLESSNFDGIDLDWEFPAWPNPDEAQKENFTILLQHIRKDMVAINNASYILSVAVGAPEAIVQQSYHISNMAGYVDFINLMSYDYHMYTDYFPLTGPNSPLFSSPVDKGFMTSMNVNWSATYWNLCGMPLDKINIGVPTYGHSYRLVNPNNKGWNAPAKSIGSIGRGGFTSYPDVCTLIYHPEAEKVFDENYLVPYVSYKYEWVSFEDILSVTYKAKFIKENKFGGAMIYSLNSDDFYGECGTVKFPLLRQLTNILTNPRNPI